MQDPSPQPKTTPARRRQGRGGGRSAGQKAYASENDAGMLDMGQHQRAPQTPDKTGSRTPGPQSTQAGSKQRSRTKPKGKANQTSPEGHQYGQSTPPQQQRRASMRSNAVPAFAGATFHASPAPSALPIPSFLSKTSSESPLGRSAARPSPPVTDNEAPTPTFSSSVPKSHESPLDFMFRAHKQEKARGSRDFSRDYDSASPHPASAPRPSTLPRATPGSSGGIDRDELDGSHGLPIGPAFSTPYQERINAARASRNGAIQPSGLNPGHPQPQQQQQPPQDDPTEALKRYLFGGGPSQNNAVQSPPAPPQLQQYHQHQHPHPHQQQHQYQQPQHHQHQPPAVAADGRSSNIHAMENDLRRILKLDMGSNPSGNSNQQWFS